MRNIKRMVGLTLCIGFAVGAAACRGSNNADSRPTDESKTQLTVGNVDGGYGKEWLTSAIAKFEEKFKDKVYETGKRGIQVSEHTDHEYHGLTNLETNIAQGKRDVYFSESVNYETLIRKKLIEDISEAVETPLTEFGEEKSISDKMFTQYNAEVYRGGKYYAVPYNIGNYGIVYNTELFEAENLYFGEDNNFVTSSAAKKGAGPDGKEGTYDDGLPRTFEEFYRLCDKMKEKGITPLVWTGKTLDYVNQTLYSLATDVAGAETMKNYMSLSGTVKVIDSLNDISDNGVTLSEITLNNSNGYKLFLNEGTYYALTFAKKLISSGYVSESSSNGNYSHLDSERDFLFGGQTVGGKTYQKIGMMFNGAWWYNEAADYFKLIVEEKGESADKAHRSFGMMPFPKADESKLGASSIKDSQKSMCMVNAKAGAAQKEAAKDFIRFLHSDEMLREYAKLTDCQKPYEFDLGDETKLTAYGNSLYNLYQNSEIFAPAASSNPCFVSQEKYFNEIFMNKGLGSEFVAKVFENKADLTVKGYMEKIQAYHNKTDYEKMFASFIG